MKSIRKDILNCLASNGEQTLDEMLDRMDGYDRKTISSNLGPTKADGLITSRRDDVTGLPAYKITDAGKKRLDEMNEKPPKGAASIEQRAVVAAVDHYNECVVLRQKLEISERQRNEFFSTAEDLRSQLDISENAVSAWMNLAAEFECKSLADLRVFVNSCLQRIESLKSSTISDEPVDVTDAAIGYLIKAPKRAPKLVTKPDSARKAALAAARNCGRADVLALVPIGKAVRGAEWKEAA